MRFGCVIAKGLAQADADIRNQLQTLCFAQGNEPFWRGPDQQHIAVGKAFVTKG
jgi:hypothetical protein